MVQHNDLLMWLAYTKLLDNLFNLFMNTASVHDDERMLLLSSYTKGKTGRTKNKVEKSIIWEVQCCFVTNIECIDQIFYSLVSHSEIYKCEKDL